VRVPLPLLFVAACVATEPSDDDTDATVDTDTDAPDTDAEVDTVPNDETDVRDTDPADTDPADSAAPPVPVPFATEVVSFDPGAYAGFGQDALPDVVLGPPEGRGPSAGGLDVLSLGQEGTIVLGLGVAVIDGTGVDLLVFENAFPGWVETGAVAISDDGAIWFAWPCDPDTHEGCAGVAPVLASTTNGVDPLDPEAAGGDAFDLADLDLPDGFAGRFVRVTDSGANALGGLGYGGTTGGFDLDAVGVVNAAP
jgi:hypothetical protein